MNRVNGIGFQPIKYVTPKQNFKNNQTVSFGSTPDINLSGHHLYDNEAPSLWVAIKSLFIPGLYERNEPEIVIEKYSAEDLRDRILNEVQLTNQWDEFFRDRTAVLHGQRLSQYMNGFPDDIKEEMFQVYKKTGGGVFNKCRYHSFDELYLALMENRGCKVEHKMVNEDKMTKELTEKFKDAPIYKTQIDRQLDAVSHLKKRRALLPELEELEDRKPILTQVFVTVTQDGKEQLLKFPKTDFAYLLQIQCFLKEKLFELCNVPIPENYTL